MTLGALTLIVLERVMGFVADTPTERTFATNLWMATIGVTMGAFAVQPRLAWSVPPLLVGAVLTPYLPSYAGVAFSASSMFSFATIAVVLRAPGRRSR